MGAAVIVEGLRKTYGALTAVDDLSFTIQEGEVFALLGPNGAGKTTTVEILEGHRARTAGRVEVLGQDPWRAGPQLRERVGIVLQEAGFDDEFTVREIVTLYRGLYPRRLDASAVIDRVGLTDKADARVKTLSGGQRRRLDLALGLVGDPDLLFLDEPTTGFDPSARRRAWDLVEDLRSLGTTVLLTTHYLDEAEHLADRVGVVVRGRLVAVGTPAELGAGHRAAVVTFRLPDGIDGAELPPLVGTAVREGLEWRLETAEPTAALHALTGWALERGVDVPALTVRRPSLEDVYLGLVGDHDDAPDAHADADAGAATKAHGPAGAHRRGASRGTRDEGRRR
ncbi:ABC transporter ATP-binding protein [Actinotalea subterranea]|uniref:ABC transporter ATP-binding protein n=1 Tax=Actinotalea subterranea TaxID=2607497 RepID=UPI001CAA8874|nr:ABC transporter ATP-binding protein [Actinotalea subterranea]